jgi:hypothetical protein
LPELSEVNLTFTTEYSETEGAEILVTYKGEPIDPEQTENELALTILNGSISEMHCETKGNDNIIRIKL